MPIYEYRCENCANEFEMIRSMSDDDKDIKCPKCGKNKVKKVMSAVSSPCGGCSSGSCSPSSHFT
ncbi:MAG: zinc ribbon domain-containing protein [Deltaproteobacteria bacterium]|nr:zinc ribbon domain-containing protein [Deltaproteobacteria bacterium]MBN2846587.1 zinc ribbon domain-containing protein [Deltaproteobacteria bacterium]